MKKLILVGLLSSGVFANGFLCDISIKQMHKYSDASNKAMEMGFFKKEQMQREFLKNEMENVLIYCELGEEPLKTMKENLKAINTRISVLRQVLR